MDDRLFRLTELIRKWTSIGGTHVDIGSDHGGLLKHLCSNGHVSQGIAVENKVTPYQNSLRALENVNVDVRYGNGLDVIAAGEMQSLSISGMGGRSMKQIFERHPDRICGWLFLQPNKDWNLVREWAYAAKFHLVQEVLTPKLFVLLVLRHADSLDPIYNSLPLEAAFEFGPHLIKERDQYLHTRLIEEREYFRPLAALNPKAASRLQLIETALSEMRR